MDRRQKTEDSSKVPSKGCQQMCTYIVQYKVSSIQGCKKPQNHQGNQVTKHKETIQERKRERKRFGRPKKK